MDKSLIEKLKEVVEQHNKETGERVRVFYVHWFSIIGDKDKVEKIDINLEK